MKKNITIVIAALCIAGTLVSSACAGERQRGGVDPIWIPVAIFSTLAAVAIAQQPVVHEETVRYEPSRVIVVEEPRRHRHHDRHREWDDHGRRYEMAQYREYR